MIDPQAVQRAVGLAMVVGNARIAAALGPDEELIVWFADKDPQLGRTVYLCQDCAMHRLPLFLLEDVGPQPAPGDRE
jgi:hypothetical protein